MPLSRPIKIPKSVIDLICQVIRSPLSCFDANFSHGFSSHCLIPNDNLFFSTSISKDNNLVLNLIKKNEDLNPIWGTTRSIVNNAIIGVSIGYGKILELTGVGFRANLKGNILNLQLGFSHDCTYEIPTDVKVAVEKQTIIKIHVIDKELVGKIASEIKSLKPAEPYKGKGIKEKGQYVLRKEGKKK